MNIPGLRTISRLDTPFKLAAGYALIGSLWIVMSDVLMSGQLVGWRVEVLKGLLFIVVTTGLLYILARRMVGRHLKMEEDLRVNQERLALALESASQGLYDLNVQTGEAVVNETYATMLGYDPKIFRETNAAWRERLHPADREKVYQVYADYIAGRLGKYRVEFRQRTAAGGWQWILSTGRLVAHDDQGRPLRMLGTHTDITERKNVEIRMESALSFTQAVLHHSPIGIIVYGADGQAVTANEAAARIAGTDVPGLLRQNFRKIESWQQSGFLAAAEQALAGGRETIHAGPLVSNFKGALWLEARFVPMRHLNEPHLLVLISDETVSRQNLEQLHLMDTAVRATPGGWLVTDAEGSIQWVNPGFTALTGYTLAEVTGKNPRVLRSSQQTTAFYTRMWQTIKRGEVWSGEVVNQRKDGGLYHEFMTIAPVRGADGTITQFVAMKQDITERKTLERQLARTQRLESIGLLASGIAHDLNNILAPISLSLELLKMKFPGADGRRMVEVIENSARRGAGIVRQVLTFARGMDGARAEVQPKYLLKDIMSMIDETFPRNIRTELVVAPDIRPLTGDVTQLHQVLLNLAVNARDAMPAGGVLKLGAHNVTLDEEQARRTGLLLPGDYVALTVSDTGSGIPPEVLDRMFEPFFTTKPPGKGTGLGLSTVYGIARNHGGLVEVTTELGQGTQFRVLLPAATGPAPITDSRPPLAESIRGAGRRILVVDDEDAIRQVTAEALERHGFVVETAADGEEGLEKFRRQPGAFSLVFTDLMMPRMNGYQLIREIRADGTRLPIIASSGMTGDGTAGKDDPGLAALHIKTLLIKPYTEDKLLLALAGELEEPALQKKD